MGKVEAYRCRPLGRGEYQQQEQTMTMTAAGTVEEFLVRLADGWQGAVTKRLVEEGIARFLATVSSEEAWAREQGGEVMARSASGGGGSSSSGTSPKRKEKSGSSSHPRRASGSGGGGGAGLASGTLERLVVPLPEEAANKSSLTLSETRRGLELVRRLAAPYFAREFSQPIKELHPEVWKEVRKEGGTSDAMGVGLTVELVVHLSFGMFSTSCIFPASFCLSTLSFLPSSFPPSLPVSPQYQKVITHPMDLGTITYKLRQGRYRTVSRFFRDIELVYANCERFNLDTPSPAVLAYANHLKHHTRSLWLELMVAEGEDEDEKEDGMPSVWDREAVEEKRQERQDRLLFCQDLPLSKHDVRELREKLARVQEQVEKEDGSLGMLESLVGYGALLAVGEGGGEGGTEGGLTVGRAWEGLGRAFQGKEWAAGEGRTMEKVVDAFHLVTAGVKERRLRGTEFSSIWAQPVRLVWAGQKKPGGARHQAQAYWPGMVVMYGDTPDFLTRLNESRLPLVYAKVLRKQRTGNKAGMSTHQVVVETFGAHDFMIYNMELIRPYTGRL